MLDQNQLFRENALGNFKDMLLASAKQRGITVTTDECYRKVDAQVAALEQKGIVRTLARPNLVAMSGEKASFLAGGEFPFPNLQGGGGGLGAVTIQFREFGVFF